MYICFSARQHLRSLASVMNDYVWLWCPDDIRGPSGPKTSWLLSYWWEKKNEKIIQETRRDRGSNTGSLRERRACYRLYHSAAARKRYVSGQGFLLKTLSTQSALLSPEFCNGNFRTLCSSLLNKFNNEAVVLLEKHVNSSHITYIVSSLMLIVHRIYIVIVIECSARGQVFHCKLWHQDCSSAQKQVFYRKLRNQGYSFTRDE